MWGWKKKKLIWKKGKWVDKKRKSIRWKMLSVGLIPTLLLGIIITILGVLLIYGYSTDSIHDEVEATTNVLKGCFDLTVQGDYKYEDGILKKGDVNISDATILYDIKKKSQIDITIFWMDTRVLTTVENEYGVSAVGKKADNVVVKEVLEKGEDYFSRNIMIDGRQYVGFYTPLKNENQEIVGMIFAGKPADNVYEKIQNMICWFVGFAMIAILITAIINIKFSKGLLVDIALIKQYLQMIANGNLTASIDERIKRRKDEIGEIGIYASKMCEDLKKMIELDPLTSLYNRRSCKNRIEAFIDTNEPFTVVMCDIDWFKAINDQYGHECGDYILVRISEMLKESVMECGFASRWGGEEFLLVYKLKFADAKEKVETLLERVRTLEMEYANYKIKVTLTFGLKEMEENVPYEKIIKIADDKLYEGKRNGRNQMVF